MPGDNPPSIRIPTVFSEGVKVFLKSQTALLTRSLFVLAVPVMILLVDYANDNYWMNLLVWLVAVGGSGYATWPLSRAALAAASPEPSLASKRQDWWVRDGFVRATAAFSFTVAVGTLFLVIPGLMVLMIYTFYPFLIVEKRAKGFAALAKSSELTKGNRIPLLGLVLASAVLFVPAGALFYLWGPGPLGIFALWVVGAPALSVAAATMAEAYRTVIVTD